MAIASAWAGSRAGLAFGGGGSLETTRFGPNTFGEPPVAVGKVGPNGQASIAPMLALRPLSLPASTFWSLPKDLWLKFGVKFESVNRHGSTLISLCFCKICTTATKYSYTMACYTYYHI